MNFRHWPVRANISCRYCKFRHPHDRTCEDAKWMTDAYREIADAYDTRDKALLDMRGAQMALNAAQRRAEKAEQQLSRQGRIEAALEVLRKEGFEGLVS